MFLFVKEKKKCCAQNLVTNRPSAVPWVASTMTPLSAIPPPLLLLLLLIPATALRVPGSPFPPPLSGLNASNALLVFHTDGLSPPDSFTLQLLQGVLNKRAPTLARAPANSNAELWLNATRDLWGVSLSYASSLPPLVASFAPRLKGYVLCSLADNSTNAAAAAAAALDALVVTPENAALATAAHLPLLYDVRGKDLAWAIHTFNGTGGFSFSRSVTSLQLPSESQCCMADYAVAFGALQWWQDDVGSALANSVWGSMEPPFVMLGWGPDELQTVAAVSRAGGGVVASNWASNLDVLSSFDVPRLSQRGAKAAPPREAPAAPVHTVCFLMSDGDNVQFLLGGFATDSRWFGSPARGSVAMGWTLSAAAADLAPVVPAWLYSAANSTDVFVGGVSGVGYLYPDEVLAGMDALAALSAGFMAKSGLRVLNVLARGDTVPAAAAASYLSHPDIDALIWYPYSDYSGLRGAISWHAGKPVIGGRFNLWGNGSDPSGPTFFNVTGLAAALLAQIRDPTSEAGYSLVPLHAWSHTVADAAEVMSLVKAALPGGGVEAVTPDVFVQRIIANVKH